MSPPSRILTEFSNFAAFTSDGGRATMVSTHLKGNVMNKRLAAAAVSASLLAGGAGFAIGVTGTAGAQSDPPTTTAPPTTKPSSEAKLAKRSNHYSTTAPSVRHRSTPS